MDTKQSFLEGLSRKRYLEVLKSLPTLQKERVREYGTLILTFIALSFFSVFAISPTLSTITDLRKQLADNQAADSALKTKIKNLSTLQQSYASLTPDLTYIDAAIPKNPNVIQLLGQIQGLSQNASVSILSLQVSDVSLVTQKKSVSRKSSLEIAPSFAFLIRVQGNSDQLVSFLSKFISFDRITTIDSISYITDTKLDALPIMTIHANAYYLP